MRDGALLHRRWQVGAFLLSAAVMLGAAPFAIPLSYLADRGVSLSSLDWVRRYFTSLPEHPSYWLGAYRQWIADGFARGQLPASLLMPPVLALAILLFAKLFNPHDAFNAIHGSARWAEMADLRRMKLFDGFVIVLGQWRQRRLKFAETLSALCIAPPGTGKTVSVVVPTILDSAGLSMVINDVKPELHQITSGYRARLGPVFKLEWAAIDDPASGLVHARWNPLSPASMPRRGPERDLYVDRLCSILIADPQGGADPHWSRKGRAALAGLTHYIICKAEAGNVAGLPPRWQDAEPSFAMLLDWLTEAALAAGEAIEALKRSDPNAAYGADPVRDMLMAAIAEARQGDYAHRALLELTQLANTPDRERGSVLSTMDAGLAIFKNEAVRQRTSRSDFTFADLRGMPDARGKMRPVTVYLCVNQQDARALGVITGLFVEALSAFLISHPPGNGLGPFPALFVLDEFPQMPKLQALIDGPAVGRGQKVSYLLIGQDFAQIEEKYGKTGLETLLSTTAAKIVLPLNNETVAKRFSEMVGQFTHEGESKSRTYGFSRQANPFATNVTKSLSGVPLIQPADLMSMTPGTQVLIYQSFANRPVRLKSPAYFADSSLRRRAFNPRTGAGPKPTPSGLAKSGE